MKRFLLAALAVATLAGGTAGAADMGAPPPPPVRKVAPPVVIYSWSGPYWGVNVGYSWGRLSNDWTVSGLAAGSASETQDLNGVIGGFQSGINWQVGAWVFGMEADIQATGQKGATTYCLVTAMWRASPPTTNCRGWGRRAAASASCRPTAFSSMRPTVPRARSDRTTPSVRAALRLAPRH